MLAASKRVITMGASPSISPTCELGRDREAICFAATTYCMRGEDVRDLMTVAVETRSGPIDRLLGVIEWRLRLGLYRRRNPALR